MVVDHEPHQVDGVCFPTFMPQNSIKILLIMIWGLQCWELVHQTLAHVHPQSGLKGKLPIVQTIPPVAIFVNTWTH